MPRTRSLIRTAFCWLLSACKAKGVHRAGESRKMEVFFPCTVMTTSGGGTVTNLWVVSHDVIETGQQAQAGADLHVHGSVHVVEEV